MEATEIKHFVEAALLAAGRPLSIDQLKGLFDGRMAPEKSEIRKAIERIDQLATLILGERIDRQVTTTQVLFDRNVGIGVERESMIASGGLSFCSGQRIFFIGFRMQKNRKVLADRLVTLIQHLLRRRTNDAPVPLLHRNAQLFVSNSATDEVHLHAAILANRTL